MPDTPFKAMGREPASRRLRWLLRQESNGAWLRCEKCGGQVFEGDWPFCRGSVNDHRRD